MTLSDLQGQPPIANLFISAAAVARFQLTRQCVARSLRDSWASCFDEGNIPRQTVQSNRRHKSTCYPPAAVARRPYLSA